MSQDKPVALPNMAAMARLSKIDYSYLESLDQIRPEHCRRADGSRGYPASGTPEWWALRQRYDELMARQLRAFRAEPFPGAAPLRPYEEMLAAWASLGNEEADLEYSRAYRRPRPDNGYALPLNAEEIAARNTMPRTQYGEIVDPTYLPPRQRAAMEPQWRAWAERVPEHLYPPWLPVVLASTAAVEAHA